MTTRFVPTLFSGASSHGIDGNNKESGVAQLRLLEGGIGHEDPARIASGVDTGTARAATAHRDLAEHHRKAPCQRASDRSALLPGRRRPESARTEHTETGARHQRHRVASLQSKVY